MIHKLCLFIFC